MFGYVKTFIMVNINKYTQITVYLNWLKIDINDTKYEDPLPLLYYYGNWFTICLIQTLKLIFLF